VIVSPAPNRDAADFEGIGTVLVDELELLHIAGKP